MYRRRALARKPRRKNYRKRRAVRKLRTTAKPRHHIFSETFKASNLIINNDGSASTLQAQQLGANIGSIQQLASYKALYDKYRILKLTWTIIPKFGLTEPNQAEANIGMAGPYDSNIRMHYRKSWNSSGSVFPPDELTMLQLNGVKTRLMGKSPIKISMRYPVTQEAYATSSTVPGTIFQEKNKWCSFNDSVYPNHGDLTVFTACDSTGLLAQTGTVCATVFCKVTFAVGDPK